MVVTALFLGGGQAFYLSEVVDVVSAHGFDDGPEGHGAAFGVGGGAAAVLVGDGVEEEEVPIAGGSEEGQGRLELVDCVALCPGVLVEGLNDGVRLTERGSEGLAQAEGEDDLAVGEVGDDLANAPLARGGRGVDLLGGEVGGEVVDAIGRGFEDRDGILTVKVAGVGV